MDMQNRLKNRYQLQEMRNAMLMRERMDTSLQCKHMDSELESLECLIIQIRAATGFCSTVDENFQGSGLNQMEQELAVKELCFLIMVLRKELIAARTLVSWKGEVIQKFQKDVDRQLEYLEKQAAIVKEINVSDEDMRSTDYELCNIEHQHLVADHKLDVTIRHNAQMNPLDFVTLDIGFLRTKAGQEFLSRRRKVCI